MPCLLKAFVKLREGRRQFSEWIASRPSTYFNPEVYPLIEYSDFIMEWTGSFTDQAGVFGLNESQRLRAYPNSSFQIWDLAISWKHPVTFLWWSVSVKVRSEGSVSASIAQSQARAAAKAHATIGQFQLNTSNPPR